MKSPELVNLLIQGYAEVRLRIWVDRNLEAGIFEVYREHNVLLSDGLQKQGNHLYLEFGEGDITVEAQETDHQLPLL